LHVAAVVDCRLAQGYDLKGDARVTTREGAMSTLTASPLRNQQEHAVTSVCLARLNGGSGFRAPAEIQQPQIRTLPSCRLRRVTGHIQQHLDRDLGLAELAALVYMSPYHFARLFKGSTGVPPHRFVIRQRIARARTILATPELSVALISRMVGFRSPSHFTTVFRRVTGVTPTEYRMGNVRTDGPAGKEAVMITEIVAQRSYEPNGVEQRPPVPRKATDPDAALVEQLRGREAEAVEALVRAYEDRVYRLAIRITGNASDAEEVVQDTVWTVSRKIDTFTARGGAAFGSWLYRITANAAYQKLRGRRSRRNEVSWDDRAPAFDEKSLHAKTMLDWPRRLDPATEGELKSTLCSAIDELPVGARMAFLLHAIDGLSNPEIAETLQAKPGTVKSRVYRARLFLRRRLADYSY
jgi:RNA polymerase sigma-70 factor (ECF subfamily)